MTMDWKDGYLTGVKRVDAQHKKLFVSLNDMEQMISQKSVSASEADDMISALATDVQKHFSFEEGCMMRHECPMAKKNKDEHDQLLELIHEYQHICKKRKPTKQSLAAFHKSVETWIMEHVCFVDIHLRSCVRNKGY